MNTKVVMSLVFFMSCAPSCIRAADPAALGQLKKALDQQKIAQEKILKVQAQVVQRTEQLQARGIDPSPLSDQERSVFLSEMAVIQDLVLDAIAANEELKKAQLAARAPAAQLGLMNTSALPFQTSSEASGTETKSSR